MGKTATIDKLKAIVIAGATASGKSALALDLAAEVGGTVINADSMQIYRDLPILTAQPDAAAMAAVPHKLYGVLPLDDPATAARWAELAAQEIRAAWELGRPPFLVGGTGLYLRALLEGFAPIPEIDPARRAEAQALLSELGAGGLHARLQARDPETAAKLRPSDSQRLMRAWEVLNATGKPLAWWQKQPSIPPIDIAAFSFVTAPARAQLYAACDDRLITMVARGAVEEVRAARLAYPEADQEQAGFKALGFRELARHIDGELSLEQAVAAAQQATRNYAKRQGTWFRRQLLGATFLAPDRGAMKFSQSYLAPIRHKIRDFLLTHPE
ncbi:tRNA (adenosine(37)-N6)-dimethylallyltransferase MiaA [Dongia sedimenti]|uniref:tRNA dimethylallyltransferase n=1 Tax=Dongia sedimenti TaxID=3064282 RepID=A0ABU0YEL1_9PROT|nr:tRNA (adenosine(37)-N6)-dimethylallyltransferase MiaA [Rhodospirillaceae bacterium R-7]